MGIDPWNFAINPRRLYLRWNIHARVMKSLRMRGRRNIPVCCSNNKSRQIALQTCVSRITLTIESIAIFQSIKPKFLPFHEWSKPCNRARISKWKQIGIESSLKARSFVNEIQPVLNTLFAKNFNLEDSASNIFVSRRIIDKDGERKVERFHRNEWTHNDLRASRLLGLLRIV